MKTATARDLRNHFAWIAALLARGETIILTRRGKRLGRIVPEPNSPRTSNESRRALFAARFAPKAPVSKRDLCRVLAENRGDA